MVAGTSSTSACAPEEVAATRELWSVGAVEPIDARLDAAAEPLGHGAERPPLNRLFARLRARVRRGSGHGADLPPMPPPPRTAVPRVRRSGLEAAWSARRSGLDVDEFLRERLARYLARAGVGLDRLPLVIRIAGGRVVATPRPGGAPRPVWLDRYLRENGEPSLEAESERATIEIARADAAIDEARSRLADARRELEAAASSPSLASANDDEAAPAGRPAVPPPWSVGVLGFTAAMGIANALQLAVPLLRANGISPGDVVAEASRRPYEVALPLLLGGAASACLFVFSAAAMRRARALVDAAPPRWRGALHAGAALASLAAAVGVGWTLLVPGASAARVRELGPFLVTVAFPLAAPSLLRVARRLQAVRSEAARAAAAWDRVHDAAVARWSRMNALVLATERECAALARARHEWTERLYLMRSRAAEAARVAAGEAETELAELRQLGDGIVVALELDRRAHSRHARDGRSRERSAPADAIDWCAPAVRPTAARASTMSGTSDNLPEPSSR